MYKKNEIDRELIQELADILRETGLAELEIESKGTRIRASLLGASAFVGVPPAMPPQHQSQAANGNYTLTETKPADHPGAIKSPMVGTVYLAPEPSAAPFVSVGDKITLGQTLMIVEAMKVMNPIPSPKAGTVKEIRVKNSQAVEFGDVLMIIE